MMLSRTQRAVLLGPDAVARLAARAVAGAQERWMLCQPREVRRSYVAEVVDRPDDADAEERWMLLQSEDVRRSYVRDVLSDV
jgi:hypothetical protein